MILNWDSAPEEDRKGLIRFRIDNNGEENFKLISPMRGQKGVRVELIKKS